MRVRVGVRSAIVHKIVVVALALLMAWLPILGSYTPVQAAIESLNGDPPPVTAVIGSDVTVRLSGTVVRIQYSFDGFATQSDCINPGTVGTSRTFDAEVPLVPGTYTLSVRRYTNSFLGLFCSGANVVDTLADSVITVVAPNAEMPVLANPDLVPECGIDIILVLDESGSIQQGGITEEVRQGAIDFVSGLVNTNTFVAVAEFDTGARRVEIDTTGNAGGAGAVFTTAFQDIDADYVTDFTAYINNTVPGTADNRRYEIGDIGNDDFTNWEGGFQQVLDIGQRIPEREPLVIHFTDGDPTAAGPNPGTILGTSRVGESLSQAYDEANEIKDDDGNDSLNSHIFVVGYPNPQLNEGNVQTISGPLSWPEEPNLGIADYIIKTPDVELGDIFRAFVTQFCGVTVTINKYVDATNSASTTVLDPSDPSFDPNWLPSQGWQYGAAVNVAGGNNYSWEFPNDTTAAGDPSFGFTNTAGRVNYAWQYVPADLLGTSAFDAAELPDATQQEQFYLRAIDCPVIPTGITPFYNLEERRVQLFNLPKSSISQCNYFNVRTPELDLACIPAADNVFTDTAQITAVVENVDVSALAYNTGGTAVFSVTIPSGQLQNDLYVFSDPLEYTPLSTVPDTTVRCFRIDDRQVDCLLVDSATQSIGQPLPPGGVIQAQIDISQVLPSAGPAQVQATVNGSQGLPTRFVDDSDTRICAQTTPIQLARFASGQSGGDVRFEWTTSTEVANAGFNLYSGDDPASLTPVGDFLVSSVVDSMEPTDYAVTVPSGNVPSQTVYLEEVGVAGATRLHGPYAVGQVYGERGQPKPIDWTAIAAQNGALHAQRASADSAALAATVDALAGPAAGSVESDPFVAQYDSILRDDVSGDEADVLLPFVAAPTAAPQAGSDADFVTGTRLAELHVDQTGICRVSYEDLLAAGVDLAGVNSKRLAVLNKGEPVQAFVYSQSVFGEGAYLEFYCEAEDTRYTTTNVYYVELNREAARRATLDRRAITEGAVAPATYVESLHLEQNTDIVRTPPYGVEGWFWTRLYWPGNSTLPRTTTKSFTVDNYVPDAGPASIDAEVWGSADRYCNPDHFFDVEVNGALALNDSFEGLTVHEINVANAALQEGENSFTLRLNQTCAGLRYDFLYLDDLTVTYPRAFSAKDGNHLFFESAGAKFVVQDLVSDQLTVYRIDKENVDAQGNERLVRVPAEVEAAGDGTFTASFRGSDDPSLVQQYFVVAQDALVTPDIAPAQEPGTLIVDGDIDLLMISHPDFLDALAGLKSHRESQGFSVLLVDVEDVYQVYGHGIFGPDAIRAYIADAVDEMGVEHVLLGGGDTVDYLDYKNLGSISFVPSYYEFYPSDGVFLSSPADPLLVDVDGNKVPDVALGRLPFRTPQEANTLVQKIIAYDSKDYGQTAVFAADRYDGQFMLDFTVPNERFISNLPEGWTYETAYVDEVGTTSANQTVVAAINSGVAWSNFAGHSDEGFWGRPSILTTAQVAALTNNGRPTVVSQWGCFTNSYANPTSNTMALEFLVAGDYGAAAVLGTTTRSNPNNMDMLDRKLAPYVTQPGMTVGQALQQAKEDFNASYPFVYDVMTGMTILGDPTMKIQP